MIRYLGESYKNSDDHANDIVAAEKRKKDNIRCDHCRRWENGNCTYHNIATKDSDWCNNFQRKT